MKNKIYKLTIESGIGGGTVSIFERGKILDYRSCGYPAKKADYLIEEISDLLKANEIEKSKIEEVVYSEFPGSQTGLKIGASIARGLQLSLNAGVSGKNLFDSIFDYYLKKVAGKSLIVLPAGGLDFVWRIYDEEGAVTDAVRSSLAVSAAESSHFDISAGLRILLPVHLFDHPGRIYEKFDFDTKIETIDLGTNLSGYLG